MHNALLNIFSDTNIVNGIEPNLWKLKRDILNKAVDEGFGVVDFDSPDFAFIQELKTNNEVFAAFAVHEQTAQMQAQLITEDGALKSFAKFKKDTADIITEGHRHSKTEYNTAVKRARSAAQFKQFQETAHLYPNITWVKSRAANPDPIHRAYWGTTLPINDAFWINNFPGSRWNCKCGWEVSDAEVTGKPKEKTKPVPGLDKNPASTGAIFTKTHPHFTKPTRKERRAIKKAAATLRKKYPNNNKE